MKLKYIALAALLLPCSLSQATDYSSLVNPFIGTDYTGNTYPGAQAPFGMVQLSPDNGLPGWDRIAGYYYPDSTIAGFSHTHLSGTGAGDLYDISFMPVTLPYVEAEAPLGIHSKFSHKNEQARAGYYQVMLSDYGINVELTATTRCGMQRYTFPKASSAVILNLSKAMNWDATVDTHIEKVDNRTIRGYRYSDGWARNQKVYFCTRFSKPFERLEIDTIPVVKDGKTTGRGLVAKFYYDTEAGQQLTVATGLSGVSMDGAQQNLQAEMPSDDFGQVLAGTTAEWNKELSKVKVETPDSNLATTFYTALYHTMIAPTVYSDVNGSYYGPDGKVHQAKGWDDYTTFSLWDTFRAEHPLLTFLQPKRTSDMVNSLVAFYEQNGRLPVWNMYASETDMMIGYHAVPVIVDAYLKGIKGFDAEKALQACVATANIDSYRGIGFYKQHGYVPYDLKDPYNSDNWALSKTLEYAFDDYCIALMADKMGRADIAATFYKRSQNYKNVFNPATGFMQPKDSKGQWQPGFEADAYTPNICESNAWQYLWSVQHDIDGLVKLVGGKKRFAEKLDSMFTFHPTDKDKLPIFSTGMIGQYAQGNEPSHHVAYLYNKVGQPQKGQKVLLDIMRKYYTNAPDGLCGNEDCGQMSAWYVFSSMGFYPVNPVSGQYELGVPLFEKAVLLLPNGKSFTVEANGISPTNCFVKSVKLNGKRLKATYITYDEIMAGGKLEFEMCAKR